MAVLGQQQSFIIVWIVASERLLSPIAVIQNSKSHQFEGQLTAEAVWKLHDNLTPEVAFKHNVRRYWLAYELTTSC